MPYTGGMNSAESKPKAIERCLSCDGFGWTEDDFGGGAEDCDWCRGWGYVYRLDDGSDAPIPAADYDGVSAELEGLEAERMRELGYQGQARKPWRQAIRRGTALGQDPYEDEDGD